MRHLILVLFSVCLATLGLAQTDMSAAQTEFDQLWNQIRQIKAAGDDVPENLYDRFFELERTLYPSEYEGRHPDTDPLDQGSDICPGTVITQPAEGTGDSLFVDNGTTLGMNNDCGHQFQVPPGTCAGGRDVFFQLNVMYRDSLEIKTCGSSFDTYLCLYRDVCCGSLENLVAWNDDSPLCGNRSLKSYITTCVDSGTYYIVLDGAGISAQGAYRLDIRFFHGCEPVIPPTCPYTELPEPEIVEGACDYGTEISCNDGFCSQIDGLGDLDLYTFTIEGCQIVTVSVWADDTPGRTGFGEGLDSYIRLLPESCEGPLSINDNFNGVGEGDPVGTDSRLTKMLQGGTYWIEVSGKATMGIYEIFLGCESCGGGE
jgi:hypothetical protein